MLLTSTGLSFKAAHFTKKRKWLNFQLDHCQPFGFPPDELWLLLAYALRRNYSQTEAINTYINTRGLIINSLGLDGEEQAITGGANVIAHPVPTHRLRLILDPVHTGLSLILYQGLMMGRDRVGVKWCNGKGRSCIKFAWMIIGG